MKIIITQPEIEAAIRTHILATVQMADGSDMKVDFAATRGEDGITATIDIPYAGVTSLSLDSGVPRAPDAAAPGPVVTPKPASVPRTKKAPASIFGAQAPAKLEGGSAQDTNPPSVVTNEAGEGTPAVTEASLDPAVEQAIEGGDTTTPEVEQTDTPPAAEGDAAPVVSTKGRSLFQD